MHLQPPEPEQCERPLHSPTLVDGPIPYAAAAAAADAAAAAAEDQKASAPCRVCRRNMQAADR